MQQGNKQNNEGDHMHENPGGFCMITILCVGVCVLAPVSGVASELRSPNDVMGQDTQFRV